MTLSLDKGLRSFEDILVPDSSYDDIDEVYLKEYLQMVGYSRSPREYLLQNKNFAKEKAGEIRLSVAAITGCFLRLFTAQPHNYGFRT